MKKTIYILGIVCVNIALFGMLGKMNHWPGAGVLFTLGMFIFSLIFLPLAVYNSYKGSGSKYKTLYLAGFVTAFVIIIGAIFKVQHWPGASALLILALPLPFILFLPIFIYFHNAEQGKSNTNFLGVMLLLVYIAVYSALLSINVSRNIINSFENFNNEFTETCNIYELKNNSKYELLNTQENEKLREEINSLREKSNELVNYIDERKIDYIGRVEKSLLSVKKSNEGRLAQIDLSGIRHKNKICFFDRNDALGLKNKINSYKDFVKEIVGKQNGNRAIIDSLINTNDNGSNSDSWEQDLINSKFLVTLLANFSLMQNQIRMSESEALSMLIKQK